MQEIRELKPDEMQKVSGGTNINEMQSIPPRILDQAIYIARQMKMQGYSDEAIIQYLVTNLGLTREDATLLVQNVNIEM